MGGASGSEWVAKPLPYPVILLVSLQFRTFCHSSFVRGRGASHAELEQTRLCSIYNGPEKRSFGTFPFIVNPERFRQVRKLFLEALQQEPEQRDDFLQRACAGDQALQQELASLLAEHDKKDHFLEPSAPDVKTEAAMEGQSIGPYRIDREIGRGGMGVVYLAQDRRLHRSVALKALAPALVVDPNQKERLQREARAAASLSHPSIATVYALEEFEGDLYVVSEYVRGKNLRAHLEEGPLATTTLLGVAVKIAKGLVAAHEKGVIHRDLKPENIVLSEQGDVKILDFGIALLAGQDPGTERLTEMGTLLGTPAYMAPEQLEGQTIDFRSDIFAFGILLYELASGSNPFESHTPISTIARILETEPNPVPNLAQQVPGLEQIIQKCLRKNPEERYMSTQELVADLESLPRDLRSTTSKQAAVSLGASETASEQRLLTRWWVVHQTAVLALYGLMVFAGWKIKEWTSGDWSFLLFFGMLICAAVNGTMRIHLLFILRFHRKEINSQMRSSAPWIRGCDWGFVTLLLVSAFVVAADHNAIAGLLGGVAIGYLVVSLVVEPATTKAAFSSRRRSRK